MPFDSGGNHSLPDGTIVNTGDKILPSQHNPAMQDISSSLSSVLVRDGRAGMVGNLPMGSFKVTNMGDGSDATDGATVGQVGTVFGSQVADATSKAAPVDDDYLPVYDSAAANALRKLTWANVKATLKTYFDTLYQAVDTALLKSGGTMTGKITLDGNPTSGLHAATKQYVDTGDLTQVGVGQTWQNVSGLRTGGTSYRNTTGRPVMVAIECSGSGTDRYYQISTNNVTWVTLGDANRGGQGWPISFIVPINHYYRISSAGGTIDFWSELR